MSGCSPRYKARHDNAAMASGTQTVDNKPGWRITAFALASKPAAGNLIPCDAVFVQPGIVTQVGNVRAVDIVFAHQQRLQPVAEPLCAFAHGSYDIERKIECGFALAVETAAGDRRAFSG